MFGSVTDLPVLVVVHRHTAPWLQIHFRLFTTWPRSLCSGHLLNAEERDQGTCCWGSKHAREAADQPWGLEISPSELREARVARPAFPWQLPAPHPWSAFSEQRLSCQRGHCHPGLPPFPRSPQPRSLPSSSSRETVRLPYRPLGPARPFLPGLALPGLAEPTRRHQEEVKAEDLRSGCGSHRTLQSRSWLLSEWGSYLMMLVTFSMKCKDPTFSLGRLSAHTLTRQPQGQDSAC